MPQITRDQVKVPVDVAPEMRDEYINNYMKATQGTGRLMLFACDQKVEHLNKDFYGKGIDIADADPQHLFEIGKQGVVGVLAGAYTEVHISEMITTYFFGEQTSTYLCDTEGNIVAASATTPTSYDNVLDLYGTVGLEGITLDGLRNALANSEDMGFTYTTATGSGTAYLMDIPDNNWMVLRSFPSSITNAMVTNATGAAVLLMLSIAGALALFVAVLLVQARRQSVQLLMEKSTQT